MIEDHLILMKVRDIIIVLLLGHFLCSCEENTPQGENELQNTTWRSSYSVVHMAVISTPESSPGADTVQYTSILHFLEDQFTLNVSPPVRPSEHIWWIGSRSQWFGNYSIFNDTISFIVADSLADQTWYEYEIQKDSLYMFRVPETNPDGLATFFIDGGLPWGFAEDKWFGWFSRTQEE